MKKCPYCAEDINVEAIKCKHCGEILDKDIRDFKNKPAPSVVLERRRLWSPGVAALLSFIIPGAGQMYKGHVLAGIAWLVVTGIGYLLLFIPGIILHLVCIVMAASGDPYRE